MQIEFSLLRVKKHVSFFPLNGSYFALYQSISIYPPARPPIHPSIHPSIYLPDVSKSQDYGDVSAGAQQGRLAMSR